MRVTSAKCLSPASSKLLFNVAASGIFTDIAKVKKLQLKRQNNKNVCKFIELSLQNINNRFIKKFKIFRRTTGNQISISHHSFINPASAGINQIFLHCRI